MTTRIYVERYKQKDVVHDFGYVPIPVERHYQRLVKESSGWFGTFKVTVDTEEIPDHVIISLGCFGDTGGWKSKFSQYI